MTGRRLVAAIVAVSLAGVLSIASLDAGATEGQVARSGAGAARAGGLLHHDGRWFVDRSGRVVMLRGVNVVRKSPPFHPAGVGFGDDDAAFLADRGFNLVRLGVIPEALMPAPGVVDREYVEELAATVELLGRHGIYTLLDWHQDGWGPATWGNGMPAWMTITDGRPNPQEPFPLYYVTNPSIQRAFENFWADRAGPDGIGIQTHYIEAARVVARRVADAPFLLGYEPMNEPWPGADWLPCLTGCPDQEQAKLVAFSKRFARAVRGVDRRHFVFPEPWVLFNFGRSPLTIPAIGAPRRGVSVHIYANDPDFDAAAMDFAVAGAEANGTALLATEWGAVTDPAALTRTAEQFDARLIPWVFWSYVAEMVGNTIEPPAGSNLDAAVADALTRPYPLRTNGTPLSLTFDATTRRFEYRYSTTRPDGSAAPAGLQTTISVPRAAFPTGWRAEVDGGQLRSRPGARILRVEADAGSDHVRVRLEPGVPTG